VIELECFTHWEGIPTVTTAVGGGSAALPANTYAPIAHESLLAKARAAASKIPFSTLVSVVKQGAMAYADYQSGGMAGMVKGYISNINNIRRIKG
jgi:hypothetical protein